VLLRNLCVAALVTALLALPVTVMAQTPGTATPPRPTQPPVTPPPTTPPPAPPSATPQPAAPAPAVSLPDTGFELIQFDVASRTFKRVLPFDVPFQISGPVPPGVTRIELQFVSSRKTIVTTKITSPCQPATIMVTGDPSWNAGTPAWQPDPPISWTYSPALGPAGNANFILTVPALDAQRYYLFKFRLESTLSPDKAAAFQQLAKSLFDQKLNQLPPLKGLTDKEIDDVRQSLIDAIKNTLGGDNLSQYPGSTHMFDPCVDPKEVRGLFAGALQPVLNSQDKIFDDFDKVLLPNWQALSDTLDRLGQDQQLGRLLGRLETQAKTDPAIELFLQRNNGENLATARVADKTALLGPQPRRASAGGALAPLSPADFGRVYDTALRRLDGLSSWLSEMARPEAQATPPPAAVTRQVTAADRMELERLVSRTGEVAQARGFAARLAGAVTSLQTEIGQRDQALDDLARQVKETAVSDVWVDATTTGNASTFQRYYISLDLGFLYSWNVSKLVPYAGTNIYFVPINTNVPLSQKGGFGRRFSVTLGYTLQSIADQRTRDDFAGSGALVAGAGFRVTESIRFGAGALLFYKKNSNPLITGETVAAAPYVSFSFDVNVAKSFSKIGQVFFSNP
jgi:hypothetical protein